MYRLHTFGGLWLEDETGARIESTPRQLGVLAMVAATGRRGVSRDRILGYFWPETDQERARHALVQTLYKVRRVLGADAVAGGADLRLDETVLSSDVGEFLTAAERNDAITVAELYAGPFLDGVHFGGSAALDQWAESERGRLRAKACAAIERLAHLAQDTGDWGKASGFWTRLTDIESLDPRYAVARMSAQARAGDRPGAIAYGLEHAAAIRRELEAEPDESVVRAIEQLRASSGRGGGPVRLPASLAPDGSDPSAMEVESSVPRTKPGTRGSAPVSPRDRPALWTVAAVAGLVIATAGAVAVVLRAKAAASGAQPLVLAVGHIGVATHPDSLTGGRILRDMLATGLGNLSTVRVVANSRLLEILGPGEDTVPQALSRAARSAGARQIIEGEAIYAPQGGLQLNLRRVRVEDGIVEHGYRVVALDRYALVDSALAAITRDLGVPPPAMGIVEATTRSPTAYSLYEEGLRAFYQYDLAAANRLWRSALAEDSTFAMAAYYAWWSAALLSAADNLTLWRRARTLAERLPEHSRLKILSRTGVATHEPESAAQAETLAVRYPSDPDAFHTLATVRANQGDWRGAREALERVIALDSAQGAGRRGVCRVCFAFGELVQVYLQWDSVGAAVRTARRMVAFNPGYSAAHSTLATALTRQSRFDEALREWIVTDSLGVSPEALSRERLRLALASERYAQFDSQAAVHRRTISREERTEAYWLSIISLRNQGRYEEAVRLLAQEGGTDPFNEAILAMERGRAAAAAAVYRRNAASVPAERPAGLRSREVGWSLTLAATAHHEAGDTAAVRALIDSVKDLARLTLFERVRQAPHFLEGLLLASQGRHSEAVAAFRDAGWSWTDGFTRINYELARSLLALGRPREAIATLQSALRGGIDGANLYVTRTELHELLGQSFDAAGMPDSAAQHFRAAAAAWAQADERFRPRRQRLVAWLSRHGDLAR